MIRGIKIVTFGGILVLMGFIGLLWFARPKTSVVEKRNLTQFPTLTWSSFWDGSFFKDVDTWYADTFPIRDLLISGNQSLQERYGIKSDQIVGNAAMVADEIPDADATPRPQPSAAPTPTPSPTEAPLQDGTVSAFGEMQGNIYITDNAGYELYYFAQDGADTFASTMNQFYTNVKDKVNLYVMIIPISSGIMLDEAVLEDMGSSDEDRAIEYLYGQMNPGIHTISIYDNLKKHTLDKLNTMFEGLEEYLIILANADLAAHN